MVATKKRSHEATFSKSGKSVSRKRARKNVAAIPVSLNQLRWKKVDMPDRFDDAEGFYGLEEIDGVDVETIEGKVSYKLLDPKGKGKDKLGPMEGNNEKDASEEEEEEEWTGFSDAAVDDQDVEETTNNGTTSSTPPPAAPSVVDAKPKKQKQKKLTAKKEPTKVTKAEGDDVNPFALLEEDSDVDLPGWNSLDLSLPTLRALAKLSFSTPTPIQSASIPEILSGYDLIGKASTGSGKTLAFGIPILESYLAAEEIPSSGDDGKNKKEKLPIALILAPTRELAHQIRDHITDLSQFAPDFRIATLTGGLSVQKQLRQLENGTDLIIATPGRLWEIVSEGRGWIDKLRRGLRYLVIDEADRLLQEGHFKEAEEVINLLNKNEEEESDLEGETLEDAPQPEDIGDVKPASRKKKGMAKLPNRQVLVFSATFHKGLQQKLTGKGKKDWKSTLGSGDLMGQNESMEWLLKRLNFGDKAPKFVDVNPVSQMAENLKEGIVECGPMEKDLYLYYLLLRYPCRTLVFTNSISSVKRLAPLLTELQLPASPLHSNMIQKARLRNLERFSSPSNPNSILIATDVAARGLDIKGVEMVIHYHLPRTADMYVHRSGRTARATDRGVSVLLCAPEELQGMRRLVAKVHDESKDALGRYNIKSFGIDRDLAKRLKPRVDLAKRISDSTVEKQKKSKEEDWLKTAAEELGVDYDSEEFESRKVGKKGVRGKGKRDKAAGVSKEEVSAMKAQLKGMLKTKVNAGFSTRYLTSGTVNIAQALLDGERMHENIMGVEKRRVVDEHL